MRCTSLTVVSSDLREARGRNDEARADERTPKVPIPIIPREDYPHVCLYVVRTSCSPSWHIKASHSLFACTLFARLPLSNCEFFLFLACAQGERDDTEVKSSMCIVRAMLQWRQLFDTQGECATPFRPSPAHPPSASYALPWPPAEQSREGYC